MLESGDGERDRQCKGPGAGAWECQRNCEEASGAERSEGTSGVEDLET